MLYKPRENMTAYVTYADSLQQGATAPVGALNEGETMAPYRSEQYELGFKAEFSKINLSTAIFQIDRPVLFKAVSKPDCIGDLIQHPEVFHGITGAIGCLVAPLAPAAAVGNAAFLLK